MSKAADDTLTNVNDKSVFLTPHDVKLKFIKKVYGILAVQLTISTIVCASLYLMPWLHDSFIFNGFLLNISGFGSLGSIIFIKFRRKQYPLNFILLGLFTLCKSILVGHLTLLFETRLVLMASVLTVVAIISLTLYELLTDIDFNKLNGFCFTTINIIFLGCLLQIFLKSNLTGFGIALFCTVAFAAFIVYDTDNILKNLSPDEYIYGVISLYLDMINLFMNVLRLFKKKSQEKKDK